MASEQRVTIPIGRLFRFVSGDAISAAQISSTGQYPVYGGNGIRGYTDSWNATGFNLLVGRQGALAGNIHRTLGPIYATEHALVASIDSAVDGDFAYWLLTDADLNQYAQNAAAQPGLAAGKIRKVLISLPVDIATQRFLARYLDQKTSEIDVLIEKLSNQVELLEKYRRELIARTVTRGLNPDAPMKDSGIDWITKAPAAWKTSSISVVTGENKTKNIDLSEKNLLSISYGRIIRKDIDLAFGLLPASFESYQVVEPGDIILRMTDLQNDKRSLRSAIVNERGIITSAYVGLKVRGPIVSEYFAWLLRFYDLAKVFYSLGGGVRQSANYKEIGKIPILVPPKTEQQKIADFLEEKSFQIDSAIEGINRQIDLLGKYRKQVINDAVTGKVRAGEVA